MTEAPAVVELGPRAVPVAIRHARLDLSWVVLQVLEDWTTREYHAVAGTSGETKRFTVQVRGPMPGNPSAEGEFMMTIRRYGNRASWWISPAGDPAPRSSPPPPPRHAMDDEDGKYLDGDEA